MSYPWNNKKQLEKLEVSGENNILTFTSDNEQAQVFISDSNILKVECTTHGKTVTINNSEASHIVVGEGNQERDVYHYLTPNGPAPTLRLGITSHKGLGTWSSLPHDFELNLESGFEEVFFYLLENGPKRAIQVGRGVWHNNEKIDDVWAVNHKTWSTIPMGYHPVVAEPDVHVSYIWAYLAKHKRWEKI